MLDGRKEIAKYNQFMDEIFTRMNIAIKAKHLDPMDLKLLPNADKMPRTQTTFYTVNVSTKKRWNQPTDLGRLIHNFYFVKIQGL